ncbi:MAG TPA: hypothetical protein DCE41_28120 [Cytophagales bacterium]|nr:hypothetical protein [Cytophagales bacterium]
MRNHWLSVYGSGSRYIHAGGAPPPPPPPGNALESLNFESGIEDWEQITSPNDTHDWTITSSGTPSNNTGPASASQGSSFAFLETSSCCANSSGDNARLRSPFVSGTNRAVTFDYHM